MSLRTGSVLASCVLAYAVSSGPASASSQWEAGVQVTQSGIGALAKDDLFAARADSLFAHEFFRDCFSANCNGRQAQGCYMNADSTLDWAAAFTNRYLLYTTTLDTDHCVASFDGTTPRTRTTPIPITGVGGKVSEDGLAIEA